MLRFSSLVITIIILLVACKKEELGSFDANFIGEWHTSDSLTNSNGLSIENYMIINGDNSEYGYACETNCNECGCIILTTGKATVNKDHDVIYIGKALNGKKVKLKINEGAHLNADGRWECKIDGFKMIRNQ
jgi:hypothetical protein